MPGASEKDLKVVSDLKAARIGDLRLGASLVSRTVYGRMPEETCGRRSTSTSIRRVAHT